MMHHVPGLPVPLPRGLFIEPALHALSKAFKDSCATIGTQELRLIEYLADTWPADEVRYPILGQLRAVFLQCRTILASL